MADYKRLVSYIYNYESGIRKRNVGFSRVESKNGQCKVTIHITASASSVEPLKVYLFHRKAGKIEGILFGEMALRNGTGDFRGETSTASLMNTGYCLDDICGVLLFLNKNKFFGSQWDDEEIRIENFVEYSEQRSKERVDQFIRDIKVQPQDESDMQMEEELAKQLKETKEELKAAEVESAIQVDEAMETVVDSVQSMFQEESQVVNEEVNQSEVQETVWSPSEEQEIAAAEVLEKELQQEDETNLSEEEVKVSEIETAQDIVEEPELEEVVVRMTDISEEISKQSEISEDIPKQAEEKYISKEHVEATSVGGACCESKNYPECVKRIMKSFPSVKPFPESKPENWVRIEPKDIGMLPVETWVLANNSFLLHGYYNYRHLVFGILQMEEGEQYVIGVPGVLQTTEQTMAGMFGFHRFVSANEGQGQYGNFGYWIQQVIL